VRPCQNCQKSLFGCLLKAGLKIKAPGCLARGFAEGEGAKSRLAQHPATYQASDADQTSSEKTERARFRNCGRYVYRCS
jgi:hypothetical protein